MLVGRTQFKCITFPHFIRSEQVQFYSSNLHYRQYLLFAFQLNCQTTESVIWLISTSCQFCVDVAFTYIDLLEILCLPEVVLYLF